jgi:hypothetical protein
MTSSFSTTLPVVRVAIDVAKLTHQVLLELPDGKRRVVRRGKFSRKAQYTRCTCL